MNAMRNQTGSIRHRVGVLFYRTSRGETDRATAATEYLLSLRDPDHLRAGVTLSYSYLTVDDPEPRPWRGKMNLNMDDCMTWLIRDTELGYRLLYLGMAGPTEHLVMTAVGDDSLAARAR